MKPYLLRQWILGVMISFMCVFLCACGYSGEEKRHRKEIREQGRENAVNYIQDKYGFTPEVETVEICMEQGDAEPLPWANGFVLVSLSYGDKKFKVHISGEERTLEGRDDFQQGIILEEAKAYFESLLGYEIYDIYLQYRDNQVSGEPSPACHEDWLIGEQYEAGNFESFLQNYPVNMRIDDCTDQDLTIMKERNPDGAAFFEEYAREYNMKAVLISYRSAEEYEKGYSHTYGRGGLLDFEIWNDGLYINSFAAFEKEGMRANRFELQECDGIILGCFDEAVGNDLLVLKGRDEWQELGETSEKPLSEMYSVDRDGTGEITVYIPTEQYGRNISVFIQHGSQNQWWQYEGYKRVTKDKEYVFITYHGVDGGGFGFRIFSER